MPNITDYQTFKDHCMRRLGHPVITINLDVTQIDDAIEEAFERFWEEHMDGSKVFYYVKTITAQEASDSAFTIPESLGIDRIARIIQVGNSYGVGEWHTVPWQTAYSVVSGASGYTTIRASDFTLLRQRLKTIRSQFDAPQTFKYTKHSKVVELQMRVVEGQEIAMETFQNVDPRVEGFEDAFNNAWLQAYATALIRKRWGDILINLQGVKLAGGLEIDGQRIYETAVNEIEKLETELRTKWQAPLGLFVG